MASTCFVTPASFSVRSPSLHRLSSVSKTHVAVPSARPVTKMSLFGGFNNNPFGGSCNGMFGGSKWSFGSGSGMGSGSGSGSGYNGGKRNNGRNSGGSSGAGSGGGNIFLQLWTAYNSSLERFPILTKAMTSLIGFALGDFIAQKFLGTKGAPADWKRVGRMAAFGFLIHGPTGHYFYSALDRLIVGTSPIKVASKVVIDQVFWAPIFTAIFFAFLGFAEGKPVSAVKAKIQNDTWTGVTTSWKFWPLAHTINFAFIPTAQRLLYINTLQVGYNVILSIIGNK